MTLDYHSAKKPYALSHLITPFSSFNPLKRFCVGVDLVFFFVGFFPRNRKVKTVKSGSAVCITQLLTLFLIVLLL